MGSKALQLGSAADATVGSNEQGAAAGTGGPNDPNDGQPSLAQKTLSGFVWLLSQTLGAKLVNMAGQIVLARLLAPDIWGLIALAYTVTAFATLLQQAGLREILIHRQAHFRRWANPAFWMSLSLGCLGAVVMVALAPVAWRIYEYPDVARLAQSQLVPLILVLAAAAPFSGLDIVADAKLTSELRFGYLSVVKWVSAVGTMALSILFAKLGFKAYSFVLPQPIMTGVRLLMLWVATRGDMHIRRKMQVRRWKYLVTDSVMLLLANFFIMLTWQGDYIVLGSMHKDSKVVGIYFFAFNLSIQTLQVFTSNLTGVLFPALSKLQNDRAYQTRAFLHAAGMLAVVGVPLCFLQAALAGPAMSLVFNSWWWPAIRVLQLLSIGMAVRLVSSPGGSLVQAQGRFTTYLGINAFNAVIFLSLVALGSWMGFHPPEMLKWLARGPRGEPLYAAVFVAGAVMLYFTLIGPVFLYIAIRPGGGTARDVWRVYAGPIGAGIVATLTAVLLGRAVGRGLEATVGAERYVLVQLTRIIVISLTSVAIYLPLVRWFSRQSFAELVGRITSIYRGPGSGWARRVAALDPA